MTLVYPEGDFCGFLTAILETWVHHSPEWAITVENGDWFGPEGPRRSVVPDCQAAERVLTGVRNLAGSEAVQTLADAFRHGDRGKEALLAEFIRLCVRHRTSTLGRLVDPEVRETVRRARAVRSEAHRYLGLIRFQAVRGQGLYGVFGPDHDVLGLLVPNFSERLAGRDWMLHDRGRRTAWICQEGSGMFVRDVAASAKLTREAGEPEIQDLWKRYFQTAAIPGKTNLRLQKSRMPVKTWKHLVESPGSGVC